MSDTMGKRRERRLKMARGKGSCGGTRRFDGSGKGRGNKGTKRQPKK